MFPEYDYYLMAHAQKPIFFFRLNGQVQVCLHGVSVQSAIGSLAVCILYVLVLVGLSSAFVPSSESTHPILLFPLHSLRSSCRPPSRSSCDLQIAGRNAYITVVREKSGV